MAAAAQEKAQAQIVASQRKQQIAHTQSLFDSVYAQQKATSAWEQGGAAARTFGRDIFYMSVQIAAAATALAVMTSANVEFERAMAKVGTMLSTANKSWIDTYRKGILDLSQETGKSAKDIAGAMYEILSAAIPPRQAMEILKGGSTLAVAGFVDLKDAINPIITTLNVYKMTSSDVGDITDKMFAALERGVFDMQQFSTQFGDIAATAKSAGVSFEELLAVISLLTRNGLQMNEAVTATQGLLKTFINPTREATIAMRDYSRYNKDLTLQLNSNYVAQKGIIEVIKEFGKLSTQERNNIIGRIEGIKALTILVGKEGELRKDLTNIMNSQGKASEKEAEVKKNVAIQVDQVVQGIKRLGIEYGKISFPLTPFKAVLTYFNNISDSMKTFIGTTGQAVIVIGTLASAMAILRSAFAALSASMLAIRGVNTALFTGFMTYQTLLPTISRAMGPLGFAGAIGAAALAAEGLAQWLTWLHDNSDWLDKYLGVSPEKMLQGLSLENQYQELLLKRKKAVDKLAEAYIREGLSAERCPQKS